MVNKPIVFVAVSLAGYAGGAQAASQDLYCTIPAWVILDRAQFTHDADTLSSARASSSLWLRNSNAQAAFYAAPAYPVFGRVVRYDVVRWSDNTASYSPYASSVEPPRNELLRPTLSVSDNWKLTVPNVKKNVARVLLRRSF